MKRKAALAALVLLAACAPPAPETAAAPETPLEADNCNRNAAATIAFSAPDAVDVVEAHSFGPSCDKTFVVFTVRNAEGAPLAVWSTMQPWLAPRPSAEGESKVTVEMMDEFLGEWVKVKVDTTTSLPDWPQRATAFKDQLSAFMTTPFSREEYLDIRARGAPRLCFATGVSSGQCLYFDARNGAAPKILDTGV